MFAGVSIWRKIAIALTGVLRVNGPEYSNHYCGDQIKRVISLASAHTNAGRTVHPAKAANTSSQNI